MSFFSKQGGLGFLEYLLILVVVILGIIILVKLFGPAVTTYIETLLKNV
jgi:hypothetical protein